MLVEIAGQLLVLVLGYALGAAVVVGGARLLGLAPAPDAATWMVLVMPLATVCVAEGFSGLWRCTPGSLGLGGLVAFVPMLVGAVVIAIVALAAQRLLPAHDASIARDSSSLTSWTAVACACAAVAVALWRWWPEPRARLW